VPGFGDSLIVSGIAHTSAVDSGGIIISTVAVAAALVAFSTVGLVRRPRRPVTWRVAAVEGWFVLQCVSGRPHRVKITFDSEDRWHTWGTVHHEMLHAGDVVKLGPIVQFSDGGARRAPDGDLERRASNRVVGRTRRRNHTRARGSDARVSASTLAHRIHRPADHVMTRWDLSTRALRTWRPLDLAD
jgi:hypothetical protein